MRLRHLALAVLAAPFAIAAVQRATPRPDAQMGFEAITIEGAKRTLGYLAGPECEGRGTGQPGYDKAAEYMAKRFKDLGLKPVPGLDGYFQKAPFFRVSMEGAEGRGPKGRLGMNDLFFPSPNSNIDVRGPVVSVRVEGTTRLRDVTPYAGKIVVLSPALTSGTEEQMDAQEGAIRRATNRLGSQDSEAKLVLIATPKAPRNHVFGRRSAPQPGRVATAQISVAALERVGLAPSVLASNEPVMNLKATLKVESIQVANVVAMIEGTDPVLKSEWVGLGAHLDHLGRVGDTVYWGADDDGSGSTALVEVATAFAKNPVKPKRSIIFMAFFGEEMGLLGSRHFAENSPVDLTKMVAELQMDMVGRDSEGVQNGDPKRVDDVTQTKDVMRLVGSKRISTELDRIVREQNAVTGFTFRDDAEDVYTRSDHYEFAKRGVPIAFFFDGFHPQYHQADDTIEKINWDKLTRTAKLAYLTAFELATRPNAPVKDVPQKTDGGR